MLVKGTHADMPSAVAIEMAGKKKALKRRAAETVETPQLMINSVRNSSSLAAQGAMESDKTLARLAQRNRNRLGIPATHFTDLASIMIPAEYTTFESSPGNVERFLLVDSGSDFPDRILMFGRQSASEWIRHVTKLYVDGTFSLASDLFSQVFVILAERPGIVTPLCYVLLPNKRDSTYSKVSFGTSSTDCGSQRQVLISCLPLPVALLGDELLIAVPDSFILKMVDMLTLGWPDLNPKSIITFEAYFPKQRYTAASFILCRA